MERRAKRALVGVVSLALIVSLIGVLPVVAHRGVGPTCTITAASKVISQGGTDALTVTITRGPHSVTLSAAIKVEHAGRHGKTSTDVTPIDTNTAGTGTVTVTYPTDFPSPASTSLLGGYSAGVSITGYSVAVSCGTTFGVN